MKRKRRKVCIFSVCLLVLLIGVSGIFFYIRNKKESRQVVTEIKADEITVGNSIGDSYGNIGFFQKNQDGMLVYTDGESGKTTFVCDKVNCQHEPYREGSTTDCAADIHTFSYVIQQGNWIYLVGHESDSSMENLVIYREGIDGTNREKLLVLNDTSLVSVITKLVCNGRWLAMSYTEEYEYDKNGRLVDRENRDAGVILVDLNNKTVQKLQAGNNDLSSDVQSLMVTDISLTEEALYYTYFYLDEEYEDHKLAKLPAGKQEAYQQEHSHGGDCCYLLKDGEVENSIDEGVMSCILKGQYILASDVYGNFYFCDRLDESEQGKQVIYHAGYQEYAECPYRPWGIMGDKAYYSKYLEEQDTSEWYVFDIKTGKSQFLFTASTTIDYISESYLFATRPLSGGGEDSVEVFCLKPEDFKEETFSHTEDENIEKKDGISKEKGQDSTVVWAAVSGTFPDENVTEKINQYLKENGYHFQVAFQCIEWDDTDKITAEAMEENYPDIDILQIPGSEAYANPADDFVRNGYYLPLDEYLQEDGKKLKDALPELLWEQGRVDGSLYTLPNTWLDYYDSYFIFNSKYVSKNQLKEFDGSLEGLERLLKAQKLKKLESPVVLSGNLAYFMYGNLLDATYCFGLCLSEETGKASLWYQNKEVREFYRCLNRWYQNGWISGKNGLSNEIFSENMTKMQDLAEKGNYFVEIGCGDIMDEMKQKENLFYRSKGRVNSLVRGSTGVAKNSVHQEQALSLLQLAYTEQEFANLMTYGVQGTDYQLEKNKVSLQDESDTYLVNMLNREITLGNIIAASPLKTEKVDSYQKKMFQYFEGGNAPQASCFLGFHPDFRGKEEFVEKLMKEEEESENIWKSTNFEKEYDNLVKKLNTKENREYVSEINRQLKDWNQMKK
ncbi:MAG: extracellular solute-binding protein [Lachnospiraceae bacterium]|nr:extracellular solute-binding protein [Lachnospiraceae bacterium]